MRTLYRKFKSGEFNQETLPMKDKRKPNGHQEKRGKQSFRRNIRDRDIDHPNYQKEFGHLEGDTIVGRHHKSVDKSKNTEDVFMTWMIGLIIITFLILIPQRNHLKKKKEYFLKESTELQEMKGYAKESLENSNEIITIRVLRKNITCL